MEYFSETLLSICFKDGSMTVCKKKGFLSINLSLGLVEFRFSAKCNLGWRPGPLKPPCSIWHELSSYNEYTCFNHICRYGGMFCYVIIIIDPTTLHTEWHKMWHMQLQTNTLLQGILKLVKEKTPPWFYSLICFYSWKPQSTHKHPTPMNPNDHLGIGHVCVIGLWPMSERSLGLIG